MCGTSDDCRERNAWVSVKVDVCEVTRKGTSDHEREVKFDLVKGTNV